MKNFSWAILSLLMLGLGCGAASAKGGLPPSWKMNSEADVPKGTVTGGDACTKVTAIAHDLDEPYSDPVYHDPPQSGRDRMSGKGQYADPKELKNWVEFRLRETCGNKKLWAQMWAKTSVGEHYNYVSTRKCPGWMMKQNYLMPAPAAAPVALGMPPAPGAYLKLDVYNYKLAPKSVEVRLWDAKDIEGQGRGAGICPK